MTFVTSSSFKLVRYQFHTYSRHLLSLFHLEPPTASCIFCSVRNEALHWPCSRVMSNPAHYRSVPTTQLISGCSISHFHTGEAFRSRNITKIQWNVNGEQKWGKSRTRYAIIFFNIMFCKTNQRYSVRSLGWWWCLIHSERNCSSLQILVNWLLIIVTNLLDIREISHFFHVSCMALI